MFRALRSTRRKSFRATAASFALAVAMVGGVAVGSTAVTSDAAFAQEENSRPFREAYQPVVTAFQAQDYATAAAALPALEAAIQNNADRDVAGNIMINVGSQTSDRDLQRRGLAYRLQSGLVAPEQQGLFNWFAGNLSYEARMFEDARRYLEASRALGYQPDQGDAVRLIAESYNEEGNEAAAIQYLQQVIAENTAAGVAVPEIWLVENLQSTYLADDAAGALTASEWLVSHHPTQQNWVRSLQVVNAMFEFEPAARVDMYRLMRLTDSLTDRTEFVRYAEDLDPRVMSNEVLQVLQAGVDAGVFTTTDSYYTEVKAIADQRAPVDRREADSIARDGETGDALDAMVAGNVLYSLGDFARAETMYSAALAKGGDADTANLRIGIAQAEQGNYAAALESFGKVAGVREPIARMWTAYANAQM